MPFHFTENKVPDGGANIRAHYMGFGITATKGMMLEMAGACPWWEVPPELAEWDDDMPPSEKLRWYGRHVVPRYSRTDGEAALLLKQYCEDSA